MNLSDVFIRRPVMTFLIMISLMVLGIMAYIELPVADLPSVDYPTIQVTTSLPGASPDTMASSVATPLEKQFMSIQGIDSVISNNVLGKSTITLQFNINKNLDTAAVDVQTAIATAQRYLPSNLPYPPTFRKVNPADTPIIYLAITSKTMTPSDIYNFGSTFIGQRLSIISGVAEVATYGYPYALRVSVDPDLIASKGVTLTDISDAIQRATPNLPTGQLDGALRTNIIQTYGQIVNAEEMNPVIIRYVNGAAVRIEDIGQATDSIQNIRFHLDFMSQGKEDATGVILAIKKQPGTNTLEITNQIKQKLPELRRQVPQSINIEMLFDRSVSIEESIFDVEMTLFIALVLVIAVIYFYLGKWTDTIIPSLAMPMSIFITFYVMTFFNFTIDNLSLLAMVLATGFIVDDAIVMLENIVRKVEEGSNRLTAAYEGSSQISFTILSMTLSLVAVFIPLVFMQGIIGKIFYEFSVVMIIVILASGFISISLTPLLGSLFIDERHDNKEESRVEKFSKWLNNKTTELYKKSLSWALLRRPLILATGIISLLLTLFLFWHLPKDFLPNDDIGLIRGFTEGVNQGGSPSQMDYLQKQVANIIKNNPNVKTSASYVEDTGFFFISLKPFADRESAGQVMKELYAEFSKIAGINVFLKNTPLINLSLGTQSQGAFQYTITSLNKEALFKAGDLFLQRLKNTPGFIGVSSDLKIQTPQLDVTILRDEASSLGVEAIDIENTLLLAFGGGQVSLIETPFDQYQIILDLLPSFRKNTLDLSTLWVRSRLNNQLVPLSSVASWKETLGAQSINHYSQFPSVTFSFSTTPGFPLSDALAAIKKISSEVLPADVIGLSQGETSTFEKSLVSSAWLFLGAIFAIYVILGILYESFIHPLTILSSLPPAIVGGLLTLWLFNMPLSLYAYLGLILLIGIVKKNGILVIDFTLEKIREKNVTPEQAIFEGSLVRLRPIMMTTFCAIAGALPIALGMGASAASRRPLGLVIIGGLIFSQLITLYLTPVVYLYLEPYSKKYSFKTNHQADERPEVV